MAMLQNRREMTGSIVLYKPYALGGGGVISLQNCM